MRRRRHSKKWIFPCLLLVAGLVPTILWLQNHAGTSSSAMRLREVWEPQRAVSERSVWNVRSEGYGWTAETQEVIQTAQNAKVPSSDPGEKPYPTQWNLSEETSIFRTSYGPYSGDNFFFLSSAGQVQNKTSLSNTALQTESELAPAFTIQVSDEPQVLIMHTHTTETFEPCVRNEYDPSFNYRTTDPAYNMVSVGDAITEQLEAAGIHTIHDTTIHDYPSYNGAYERSAETVKQYLEQYPSICVVLDIHRDAIQSDNTLSQPIVEIDGREAAQVMIISGCDDGTMEMPNYLQNFHFACRLQGNLEGMYPGLTRPILFDYRKYNQDLTTGSLLLEVGSHGNTLEQAQYSGELIGKALAQTLLKLQR
ncbi:MAG: stage II sporulation protein P [Ruminococcus sp.]|uniref:stage II sporulation protein P n=1 Tax=Ruminococcus sp. TaxID=41978 RepID=UPI003994F4AC